MKINEIIPEISEQSRYKQSMKWRYSSKELASYKSLPVKHQPKSKNSLNTDINEPKTNVLNGPEFKLANHNIFPEIDDMELKMVMNKWTAQTNKF